MKKEFETHRLTAPTGTALRELNDHQSAKYNLMQSRYETWYQQAAATFCYTDPTIIEGD